MQNIEEFVDERQTTWCIHCARPLLGLERTRITSRRRAFWRSHARPKGRSMRVRLSHAKLTHLSSGLRPDLLRRELDEAEP
jgi:hypothetical protein